jgi:hypothetical protein
VRKLHAYTSFEQWPAMCESGEVPVDELTTDPDRQLDEHNRVRLVVAVPNRWPKRKPVPTARWVQAVDRRDGATLWDCRHLRVCSPPRSELFGAAD